MRSRLMIVLSAHWTWDARGRPGCGVLGGELVVDTGKMRYVLFPDGHEALCIEVLSPRAGKIFILDDDVDWREA